MTDTVFVFLSPASAWSRATSVLVGPESVYDNCEEADCGTPDWIFEMGFRYGFLTSDIYQVYVSAWIENDGADTFENFCRCMSNYVTIDALTFPHTI